jgi:hypothetical protein
LLRDLRATAAVLSIARALRGGRFSHSLQHVAQCLPAVVGDALVPVHSSLRGPDEMTTAGIARLKAVLREAVEC